MHNVREINGLHGAGMEHWLPMHVLHIAEFTSNVSPSDLGQKCINKTNVCQLCNCFAFLMDFQII